MAPADRIVTRFLKIPARFENFLILDTVAGDSLSRPTLSSIQKQEFSSSLNSAGEGYFKLRRESLHQTEVADPIESSDAMSKGGFAKSWPLVPIRRTTSTTRLPQIFPVNENDVADDVNDFRNNLTKFNKSRKFRLNRLEPVDEKPKQNQHPIEEEVC